MRGQMEWIEPEEMGLEPRLSSYWVGTEAFEKEKHRERMSREFSRVMGIQLQASTELGIEVGWEEVEERGTH